MRIGSLFSGIGGLELGLERAGLGYVAWQCEKDDYRRSVLERHWPTVYRYDDVESIPRFPPPVDILCGGFPCQDLSGAHTNGKRRGLEGPKSGLWSQFRELAEGIEPDWVIVENVYPAHDWLPFVRRDLHEIGYSSVPFLLRAEDVGAPHERPRVFLVAHADSQGKPLRAVDAEVAGVRALSECRRDWGSTPPGGFRVDDGVPAGLDRLRALGNAVVPACAEVIGRMIKEFIG